MIYMIRHGQTNWNLAKRLLGRTDEPLNGTGRKQAEKAAGWFRQQGIRFDRVLSSPLSRAVETARILAPDTEIETDPRLLEMEYGSYEGTDLTSLPPEILAFFGDFVRCPAPDSMEQLEEVTGRLGELLEEVRGDAAEKTILMSTHAVAMKGALEYLTPASRGGYWSRNIPNCAVYCWEVCGGQYTVPRPAALCGDAGDGED